MKYGDDTEIQVGDTVSFPDGSVGEVVVTLDSGVYSECYPEADWSYLNNGVLVLTESVGLIHYPSSSDVDFVRTVKGRAR